MSNETRRVIRNQEWLCRYGYVQRQCPPIRALNARGYEVTLWPTTTTTTYDDVYVFDSLDLNHNNNSTGVNVFGANPATQDSIENLERFRIIEGEADTITCSICLGVLSVGSEAIRMPHPCSHVYHHHCIIKWLNMSNTCPLCRRTI